MINQIIRKLNLPVTFNMRYLKAFIYFSIIGNLLIIGRTFQYFDYIFPCYLETSEFFLYFYLGIWLTISIIIAAFPTKIWFGIVNVILSSFLLRGFVTFGIFEATHLCVAWATLFSMCLIRGEQKKSFKYLEIGSIGLYSSVFFFGLIFLHAGVDKAIDPYWQKGIGFRNFIELEYLLPENLQNAFLNSEILLITANYFAITAELLFLPLFVFRKLRPVALVFYSILGIQLLYPLNIFLIGYCASIFIIPIAFFSFAKGQLMEVKQNISKIIVVTLLITTCLFINSIRKWYIHETSEVIQYELKTPSIRYFKTADLDKKKPNNMYEEIVDIFHLDEITNPFDFVYKRLLRQGPVALFSSRHTVGVFCYRIIFTDKSGVQYEPIVFFKENGRRGSIDSQYLNLNTFQGSTYSFGDLIYWNYEKEGDSYNWFIKTKWQKILKPLIKFTQKKLNQDEIIKVTFKVKSLGNDCPKSKRNWQDMIVYDCINENIEIRPVDILDCNQGRNKNLKNYLL